MSQALWQRSDQNVFLLLRGRVPLRSKQRRPGRTDGRMDVCSRAAARALNHCPRVYSRAVALRRDLQKMFGQRLRQSRTCSGSGLWAASGELLVSHDSLQMPSADQILKGVKVSGSPSLLLTALRISSHMMDSRVRETGPHHGSLYVNTCIASPH